LIKRQKVAARRLESRESPRRLTRRKNRYAYQDQFRDQKHAVAIRRFDLGLFDLDQWLFLGKVKTHYWTLSSKKRRISRLLPREMLPAHAMAVPGAVLIISLSPRLRVGDCLLV